MKRAVVFTLVTLLILSLEARSAPGGPRPTPPVTSFSRRCGYCGSEDPATNPHIIFAGAILHGIRLRQKILLCPQIFHRRKAPRAGKPSDHVRVALQKRRQMIEPILETGQLPTAFLKGIPVPADGAGIRCVVQVP